MAPKRSVKAAAKAAASAVSQNAPSTEVDTTSNVRGASSSNLTSSLPPISSTPTAADTTAIIKQAIKSYISSTPLKLKLVDAFLLFLVDVGILQFIYCVIFGNYPFNAFLSGFAVTVGQFVLAASLRIQSNPDNGKEFSLVTPERAFADFIFGSLILHFFAYNFIN
ncbi:DAD family-domain-containing protein [Lipomyces japonicus]|uniref:DAD family-domain-containing protein n=1 Tax=Lipomyces japonicus TaxID=56871 RepID=UPI0034CDD20D